MGASNSEYRHAPRRESDYFDRERWAGDAPPGAGEPSPEPVDNVEEAVRDEDRASESMPTTPGESRYDALVDHDSGESGSTELSVEGGFEGESTAYEPSEDGPAAEYNPPAGGGFSAHESPVVGEPTTYEESEAGDPTTWEATVEGQFGDDEQTTDRVAEPSSDPGIAIGRGDADDDVHFGVAAKALGVSRKTVERMVKRGQLDRGSSGAPATVSTRSLMTVLEQRRVDLSGVDLSELTSGTSIERAEEALQSFREHETFEAAELEDLFPLLENLTDELVAARTRAAVLENELDRLAARAEHERSRDELLLALATGNWRQRRKARSDALRHFVRRGRVSRQQS